MNKEELLQELSSKLSVGEISREEVMSRLNITPTTQQKDEKSAKRFARFSATRILYVLGAVIVIVGIIIFFAQVWDDIGSLGRI